MGVVRAARVLQIKVVARNSSCGTLKPRETMTYSSRAGNHRISCCGAAFYQPASADTAIVFASFFSLNRFK
jgi:hypothetical protein